jgi:RNA polymerase sigma-70 factor (ECF subfamily)
MDKRARAIERLYEERYARFHGVLSTITGGYETGHDAVQEAFARALAKRSDFRGDGSLEAWVWRIAIRTALELHVGREVTSPNGTLDPALVEDARDRELAEALRRLSPRRRLMIFLRYYADLSYAQIADACGVSEGTVAATLARARDDLLQAAEEARASQ